MRSAVLSHTCLILHLAFITCQPAVDPVQKTFTLLTPACLPQKFDKECI